MRLEFFDWDTGFHGICPEPIDRLTKSQGFAICKAISHAVQYSGTMARLINSAGITVAEYSISSDSVYEIPQGEW